MTQEPLADVYVKLIVAMSQHNIMNYKSTLLNYKLQQTQKTGKFKNPIKGATHWFYNTSQEKEKKKPERCTGKY